MSKLFTPSVGPYEITASYGGWQISGADQRPIAIVPSTGHPVWMAECNAKLMAGSYRLLCNAIKTHNLLNDLASAHDPVAMARRLQEIIRNDLKKVVGDLASMTHYNDEVLIVPDEVSP